MKSARETVWSQAPAQSLLSASRVDVWRVFLDDSAKENVETGLLSPDETARANRFLFEKDRNHFSRCRSALRSLLGGYLETSAAEIRFECLPGGKPKLTDEQNPQALQFNVSHSGGVALIAVGSNCRIGVDIEKIRSDVDTAALAERFFSVRERDGLRALPDHVQVAAFYACWTRKESFLKATGDGLSFPLSDFSVTTHPDDDPALEEIRGDTESPKHWALTDLDVLDGYRAAVALDRSCAHLQTYLWQ